MEEAHSETPSVRTRLLRALRKPSRGLANVRRLIPECSNVELNEALVVAARRGRPDLVQEFLPLCDSTAKGRALVSAARADHAHVLRELIPAIDSRADVESALYDAAHNGNVDAVRELIPACDRDAHTEALREAAVNRNLDVIRVLVPVSDTAEAFRGVAESLMQLIQEYGLVEAAEFADLAALDALAPYVDEAVVESVLNEVVEAPLQLLRTMPRLAAILSAAQLRQTEPPAAIPRVH
ncbi:MAG: hypothetical protein AMXMBFR59_12660 [Rhodanobacteraceae bacterium]